MAYPADPTAITDPSLIELPIDVGVIYYSRVYAGVVASFLAISSVLVGVRVFTRFKSATLWEHALKIGFWFWRR